MKLVSYGRSGEERAGIHLGEVILDLEVARPGLGPGMRSVLERADLETLRNLVESRDDLPREALVPAQDVRLGPPVLDPSKIICLGLNYRGHAEEQDRPVPERPLLFSKASTSLAAGGDPIVLSTHTRMVDPEAELAFVLGRRARKVPLERAMEHVAGYTILNDVTARDAQKADRQWFRGKSFDTFGPCGPWLVTPDEIPDPHVLDISLSVNGETRQRANTRELIFDVPFLIHYISGTMTLLPGDMVATGTPAGVGVFREPPVFLSPGDRIDITIEAIGTLTNPVTAA
jgi:2-keto-4-pentenoate hydratase/2-oxohepta-3-ene-1,7-dioic acid hydratase in catechol pathway